MKLQVGDKVIITAGKDKGKTGEVVRVLPQDQKVVVGGVNLYTRHIKPMQGRSGDKVRLERPLPTANVAIVNEKGQPDRVGYQVSKSGSKERVYKKTGTVIPAADKQKAADKPAKTEKEATKKTTKKSTKKSEK